MQRFCAALLSLASAVCVAAHAQNAFLPPIPEVSGPLTLSAVTDPLTSASRFQFLDGNVPPIIRVRPGTDLLLTYNNRLSAHSTEKCLGVPCNNASNLHFHGLHVSPNAPGDDEITMLAAPGQTLHYSVKIPPEQPPGLYWYHTHPPLESYQQSLDGMSGAIVVEGMDRYVPALRHMPERVLILRDAMLDPAGPQREALLKQVSLQPQPCGPPQEPPKHVFTVNGAVRPTLGIAPGEKQFWRIVNASPDLYADLVIPGSTFQVVALDGMPLAYRSATRIRTYPHVLLSPGGRVEAIVTGPSALSAALSTRCFNTGADGGPNPSMVLADLADPAPGPTSHPLVENHGAAVRHKVPTRTLHSVEQSRPSFTVAFTEDRHGFYINGVKLAMAAGQTMQMDQPMVTVKTGSYRHWRVSNQSDEVHPFHIHQVHFLTYRQNDHVLQRPEWLDTVNVPARGSVDLVMDFTDPIIRGRSLFHCHLLQHEDRGMMAEVLFK